MQAIGERIGLSEIGAEVADSDGNGEDWATLRQAGLSRRRQSSSDQLDLARSPTRLPPRRLTHASRTSHCDPGELHSSCTKVPPSFLCYWFPVRSMSCPKFHGICGGTHKISDNPGTAFANFCYLRAIVATAQLQTQRMKRRGASERTY